MRIFVFLLSLIITSSASSAEFKFNTTYWFNKISAVCAEGSCDVYVNGEFKDKYKYQMNGSVAYSNIKGIKIEYNLVSKKLNYK